MFTLTFNNDKPLYEQLYSYVREEIEQGRIGPGEKLPSKRTLSAHLKISVVTVETAYALLASEGYIYSAPGSGYYAERIPGRMRGQTTSRPILRERQSEREYSIDFSTNRADTACFPFSVWAKLSREILSSGGEELLNTCSGKGVYALRQAIGDYLRSFRGLDVYPEQIVVGAGSEYLTGLLIQLLGRDKIYGVEDPGYVKTQRVFSANCPGVRPIAVDGSGARLDSLVAQGIQVAHITPSHHFPLGTVMPAARRHEILSWARGSEDRYIIEDDYDSDFRLYGRPVPTLLSLDCSGKVLYLNTFTKSLAPSMRIGYMVIPPELLEGFEKRLGFYACTVPVFEQLILAEFLKRGYFERHISRMRKLYSSRRNHFVKALENSPLSQVLEVKGSNVGTHLLLSSKNGRSEKELVELAAREGVRVYGLSEYYSFGENRDRGCIIVGYSGMSAQEISRGVSALERAWL